MDGQPAAPVAGQPAAPGQAPVTEKENQPPAATPPATPPPSWRDGLDPTIKDHPSLKDFKGPEDLAKSWVHAQSMIGKEKIPLPGKNATAQDWEAVFDRLGRPKTADGYKIPEDYLPAELRSPEQVEQFKGVAHGLGLLPHQVDGLYKWFADMQVGQLNAQSEGLETAKGEAESSLRKEWGYAYDQNVLNANKVLAQFCTPEEKAHIDSRYGNDPAMIRLLANVGKRMSEDGIIGKGVGSYLSPEDALAEIKKIEANPALRDPSNPENELLKKRRSDLFKMAFPNG